MSQERPAILQLVNNATQSFGFWTYSIYEIARIGHQPLLIYSPGRVGSGSVYFALKDAGLNPLHVHFLRKRSRSTLARYKEQKVPLPRHFYVEKLMRAYLRYLPYRLKAITLVREPIGRHISAAYQLGRPFGYDIADEQAVVSQLTKELLSLGGLDFYFSWFDRELNDMFGLDIFKVPFDRKIGYTFATAERIDVLVLKMEKLNELWPIISDFVGREIRPKRANVRSDLRGGETYDAVRSRILLPPKDVKRIYDCKWVNHFYSQEEVERFVGQWSKGSSC